MVKHTMAFHRKQIVSRLCIILLLLAVMSFSHAEAKPCRGPGSDQDWRSNHTMDGSEELFLIDKDSGLVQMGRSNLSAYAYVNKSRQVLSTIPEGIHLWQDRPDGLGVDEASFSVTMLYQPLNQDPSSIAFLILPGEALEFLHGNDSLALANRLLLTDDKDGSLFLSNISSYWSTFVDVKIGVLVFYGWRAIGIKFSDNSFRWGSSTNYSVWIDYDRVGRRLSVYVDLESSHKPDNAIAEEQLNISSFFSNSKYVYFGVVSTAYQLLRTRGIHLSATVEDLPYNYPDKGGFLTRKVTILSSVLGSVATTAVVAAAVACYFNSRYRRWQRDLDQLARSMERLPGVPMKIDFADINKATGNFHETMKLGGGGFGTVYRCTLPAAAYKTDGPMDVAVKRFTRDVQHGCYNDFLAEVSIINRLRHKNIVPLVGWSYNKGEPLLVFEFMTNGSLDQHLFHKGSTHSSCGTKQRHIDAATRYEIVKDIATGLHYVHHEYEPMVLHRDIKASNVMLDSSFHARLGDFGLACTVDINRNSATGVGGTWGYIAPEYAMCGKATRQTDIYALGVLILEVVTGQRALLSDRQIVHDDDIHVTDRVWRLHGEGKLSECVDVGLVADSSLDEEECIVVNSDAERLLLLGLACSNPNPSDRPTMPDVVRIIAKSAPPPEIPPQKPRFVWPPPEEGCSMAFHYDSASTRSTGEVHAHPMLAVGAHTASGRASFHLEHSVFVTASSALASGGMPCGI